MTGERPRYGLRWRLRDAGRTLQFTVRRRLARYFGWGCLLLAATQLAMTAVLGAIALATAFLAVTAGGLLLLGEDFQFRRRMARRSRDSEEEESSP